MVAAHVAEPARPCVRSSWGTGSAPPPGRGSPTVAELDAVSGAHPVVLISGDAHSGWLNSRALQLLGLPRADRPGRGGASGSPRSRGSTSSARARTPQRRCGRRSRTPRARGVVGRHRHGVGARPPALAGTGGRGRHGGCGCGRRPTRPTSTSCSPPACAPATRSTGTDGLVTTGPLKVIFDGSLNTRTAWCCAPYGPDGGTGAACSTCPPTSSPRCARRAHAAGLEVAVHAHRRRRRARRAGRASSAPAPAARSSTCSSSTAADLPRFAALGVRASVQPAHLLDDRDVTDALWPGRSVAQLRAALAARRRRRPAPGLGRPGRAGSTRGWRWPPPCTGPATRASPGTPSSRSRRPRRWPPARTAARRWPPVRPADVVLLDHDPLPRAADTASAAAALREVRVAATLLGGRVTHLAL